MRLAFTIAVLIVVSYGEEPACRVDGTCLTECVGLVGRHGIKVHGDWWALTLGWDSAVQIGYLEWTTHGAGEATPCQCPEGGTSTEWISEVFMDGTLIAQSTEEEAFSMIPDLFLGRHSGELYVKDGCTMQTIVREAVDFVLPLYTHLVITAPPQRAVFAPGQAIEVCVALVLSAPCGSPSSGGGPDCVYSGPVSVCVNGRAVGQLSYAEGGDNCVLITPTGGAGAHGRRLTITAEMQAVGSPMSRLHHASLEGPLGFKSWLAERSSLAPGALAADTVIDASRLEGSGHINPCVYHSGGIWRVTFRKHDIRFDPLQHKSAWYKRSLEPSLQYDAPIHRTADGRWDLGVPPEQVLTLDGAGPPSLQGARGPQDARVLQAGPGGGDVLFWFNANSAVWPSRTTQQYRRRGGHGGEVLLSRTIDEKNFVPWCDAAGRLLFAYAVEPHEVYELDEASGRASAVAATTNTLLAGSIAEGTLWLHGGSCPVPVLRGGMGELLSLCHTKDPDTLAYKTYAYTFSESSPYGITAWSDVLPLQGKIQMAMGAERATRTGDGGLVPDEDGGVLVVSYGSGDEEMRVAEFELERLLVGMHDIAQYAAPLESRGARGERMSIHHPNQT